MQCCISVSFFPCYRSQLISILWIYKDMQFWYAYLFPIFQHRYHCYDIFSHYDLLLCSALMPVRTFWLSIAPNCTASFHSNLDGLTIVSASKRVSVPASFLQLGILGGISVLFLLVPSVTSFRFLYIPPILVLVTVSFIVGICAILGDVGVPFSAHLLRLALVEASFELLAVHSIGEQVIGAPAESASVATTTSPSTTRVFSVDFNCWYPYIFSLAFFVLVAHCNSKGFSNLGSHVGHSSKPIPKLVILDFGLGQRDDQLILNLDPIIQLLHHCLLCNLVLILHYCRKICLQACSIFYER